MIAAAARPDFAALARRLAGKARQIAEAHAESTALASAGDPARWRKPGLLWPLIVKG